MLWICSAIASDKPEYGPAPAWVQATSLAADTGESNDAAVKVLLTDWQFNFLATGSEAYFHNVMRVQTPQGLAVVGTISLPWNPSTDTLTVHQLHIIRGGQVIDVLGSGQTFTVLRRENSLEYATLNGVLTAVIQPAGVEVGDTIDLAFSIKRSDPVLAGTAEWIATGWPNVPIAHLRLSGRWTAPTKMHWRPSAALTGVREAHRGDITEVNAALDDAAPFLPPKGAPARFRIGRELEFSSWTSWSEIGERLAPLYAHAAEMAPLSPLHAEVARIRAAAADPGARAMAALRLVQDQVRYVYLGMNEGALVPADADLTWSRRFGDCKGKTALLLTLLHALDIDAEAVAVNTLNGDSVKSDLPLVEAFNHVLVRAVIDGRAYWLDGARSGDRQLDELTVPPYYWGLALVAGSTGLVQLIPTPLTEPAQDVTIHIDARNGVSGPAPVHAEAVFRGQAGALLRFAFGNLAPADRDRSLREFWSKSFAFLKADKVAATFDDGTAQEHVTLDGSTSMEWVGERYEIGGLGLSYAADLKRADNPRSDAPFAVQFPTYSRVVETIALPRTETPFTVEGADIQRTIAGSEFRRQVRIAGDVLTAQVSARSLVPEISSSGADEAQSSLREIAGSSVYLRAPAGYFAVAKPAESTAAASAKAGAAGAISLDESGWHFSGPADDPLRRGLASMGQRNWDGAISAFDQALQADPRSATALANRGVVRVWKHENDLARQDLDKAAAIDPHNAIVARGRALMALFNGDSAGAVTLFTDALAEEPDNVFSLRWRAAAYRQSGDYERALADNAAVIKLRPELVDEYVARSALLREQGRPVGEALRQAEAVVAANPNNSHAYVAAAAIARLSGKDDEAMRFLERSLAIEPSVEAYVARASYRPESDLADRCADLQAAAKLGPRSSLPLVMLARVQRDAGEFAAALATLDRAVSLDGETSALLTWRGIVYAKSDQPALANKEFAAARAKATNPGSLNSLCWNLATAGMALADALSACDGALAKAPHESAYLDSRGFVLLRLGRYAESVAAYDAALKNRPESAASLYGRGVARRLNGDLAAGEADLKLAATLDAHVADTFAGYGVQP